MQSRNLNSQSSATSTLKFRNKMPDNRMEEFEKISSVSKFSTLNGSTLISKKTLSALNNPEVKKQKLLSALRDIDEDRKGYVRKRVFFNLLDCLDFKVDSQTTEQIMQEYSYGTQNSQKDEKNESILYEQVVRNLTLRRQGDYAIKWVLLPKNNNQQSKTMTNKQEDQSQQNHRQNGIQSRNQELIEHQGTTQKERYFRKNIQDYPDYFVLSKQIKGVSRPGTSIANGDSDQMPQSLNAIKTNNPLRPILHDQNVDYRKLNLLRLTILKEHQNIQNINLIHFQKFLSTILKLNDAENDPVFLAIKGCTQDDDNKSDYLEDAQLSMHKLNLLIDLYHHYPYIRRKDKNLSQDLYYIMSSNKASKPLDLYYDQSMILQDAKTGRSKSSNHSRLLTSQGSYMGREFNRSGDNFRQKNGGDENINNTIGTNPSLHDCLQILCDKIDERFKKVANAFRFFDLRSSGKISFADFSFIIDQLQIRFNQFQVQEVFKYLDQDLDGFVTYNDFCELCEERRRSLDPFVDSVVYKARLKQQMEAKQRQININGPTQKMSTYQNDFNEAEEGQKNTQGNNGTCIKKHEMISKELFDYKKRKVQLKIRNNNQVKSEALSTQEIPTSSRGGQSTVSPMTQNSFFPKKELKQMTPSEWSNNLKKTGAFGIASDFQRPQRCEADQSGGDIRNILNYQYEKDYIFKAQEQDRLYQLKQTKQRMNLIGRRSSSGLNGLSDTNASRKRNENIKRKLIIINQNAKNQELQSPKINISKQTYYPQHLIKKYVNSKQKDRSSLFSQQEGGNRSLIIQSRDLNNQTMINKQNSSNSFTLERPFQNLSNSFRENSINSMRLISKPNQLNDYEYDYSLPQKNQKQRVQTGYQNLRTTIQNINNNNNGTLIGLNTTTNISNNNINSRNIPLHVNASKGGENNLNKSKNLLINQRPQTTTTFQTMSTGAVSKSVINREKQNGNGTTLDQKSSVTTLATD